MHSKPSFKNLQNRYDDPQHWSPTDLSPLSQVTWTSVMLGQLPTPLDRSPRPADSMDRALGGRAGYCASSGLHQPPGADPPTADKLRRFSPTPGARTRQSTASRSQSRVSVFDSERLLLWIGCARCAQRLLCDI